jgi:hypothetical protein
MRFLFVLYHEITSPGSVHRELAEVVGIPVVPHFEPQGVALNCSEALPYVLEERSAHLMKGKK